MMKLPIDEAVAILSFLPKRPDYTTWLNAISAIGNTYPEPEALSILLSHFQDEVKNQHKTKLKSRLKHINFGSLVYLAKQYGYNPQITPNKTHYNALNANFDVSHTKKQKPIKFEGKPLLCYKFEDYEAEERSAIMQYEGGITRQEADTKVYEMFPNAKRVYRVAVNDCVLNKNLYPPTRQELPNYNIYTNNFRNRYLTSDEIADNIGKGFSIAFCKLEADDTGRTVKRSENFEGAEVFAIDIDNEDPNTKSRLKEGYLSIAEALQTNEANEALLIYTSVNNAANWERYRIVFDLPRFIEDPEQYRKIVNHYIKLFGSDSQCSDIARGFYGNDNATIIFPESKTKLQFCKGVIC